MEWPMRSGAAEVLGLEQGTGGPAYGPRRYRLVALPSYYLHAPANPGQHPTRARQDRPNQIKPVRIGATAVDQDQGWGPGPP